MNRFDLDSSRKLNGYQGAMSLKDPCSRPDEVGALNTTQRQQQLMGEGMGRNKERRTQKGEGGVAVSVGVCRGSRLSKVTSSKATKETENEKYEEGENRREKQIKETKAKGVTLNGCDIFFHPQEKRIEKSFLKKRT